MIKHDKLPVLATPVFSTSSDVCSNGSVSPAAAAVLP